MKKEQPALIAPYNSLYNAGGGWSTLISINYTMRHKRCFEFLRVRKDRLLARMRTRGALETHDQRNATSFNPHHLK